MYAHLNRQQTQNRDLQSFMDGNLPTVISMDQWMVRVLQHFNTTAKIDITVALYPVYLSAYCGK